MKIPEPLSPVNHWLFLPSFRIEPACASCEIPNPSFDNALRKH